MLFTTPAFLGFLPLAWGAVRLAERARGPQAALFALIAASLVFYGWWRIDYVPLLVGSIAGNYALGQRILRAAEAGRARAARRWLAFGVAANLLLLGWFKYAGWAARGLGWGDPGIVLPLAISFFTFQQIMFLADSCARARPDAGFLPYAACVAFFPHLIAGPLVRPAEIIPQLAAGLYPRRPDDIPAGLTLLLLGMAKKLVLADSFAHFADPGFDAAARGSALTLVEAWVCTLAYALQIYFDFSGYSDMAIGLARLFGIRFPLNFASPYRARGIADFWRRWHITLGAFLRGYVYIPLGGNRAGMVRRHANLMATMLLGGLWHGAAWTFVLWGGLHGAFLVVERVWRHVGVRLPAPLPWALTMLGVLVAWVPFRAADTGAAWRVLRGMAGLDGVALPRIVVDAWPVLGHVAVPVPVLPHLGDARTLALPEAAALLALGWAIALALPHVHAWSERARAWSLIASAALTGQALFLAPNAAPFLYFRF